MAPNLTQDNLSSLKFARNNISNSKSLEMIYLTDFCVTSNMFHHKYKDKSFRWVNCETSFPVKQVFLRNELSYERVALLNWISHPANPHLIENSWHAFLGRGGVTRCKFPWSKSPWITKKKSHPKRYTPKNYYFKEKSIIIDLPSNKSDLRLNTLIWEPVCKW